MGSEYLPETDTWVNGEIKGQWYYEDERENVVFAGLNVRSHYLQLAISYNDQSLRSIVCDSHNLRQSSRSIHRKVPAWKARFDSKLKMELGRVAAQQQAPSEGQSRPRSGNGKSDIVSLAEELSALGKLRDDGLLTEDEFAALKARALEGS